MRHYTSKHELVEAIKSTLDKFLDEFRTIEEKDKNAYVEGVDRTPSQILSYQLGWINLVNSWIEDEAQGRAATTPAEGYKWNQLGALCEYFTGFMETSRPQNNTPL